MTGKRITAELLSFIRTFVHSIEQLEVLLLIREHSQRAWTVREINEVMRSDESSIRLRVQLMAQQGLLAIGPETDTYRYALRDPAYEQVVADLATAYRERRTKVIEVIYSRQRPELEAFSRAFVLKKDNGDHES